MTGEECIRAWFRCWLKRDAALIPQLFAENALYSECYGPEYHGLAQIERWFTDWNREGCVQEWTIQRMLRQGDGFAVEWFFRYEYRGAAGSFDGVSLVFFDQAGRICELREFKSESRHFYPYE